ncbi:MAG: hydrogenase 3 maturation endopeptidase HyCI [Candidatus Bathyarchaeia archaeon]
MALKEELMKFFEGEENRRIVILGIGSPIRSDDAVGLEIIRYLKNKGIKNVLLIAADTNPESFTGPIRRFNPTHVLMVDAAYMGLEPGAAKLIPIELIRGQWFTTHHLPLSELAAFIKGTMNAKVALLGIQPKSISVGPDLTLELKNSIERVSSIIYESIYEIEG